MKKTQILLGVAGLALFAQGAAVDEYKWRVSATEGAFTDSANWDKTADARHEYPQAGNLSFFYNMTGSWTVKIPSTLGDDGSYTLARGLKNGSKLVFDATETTWRKVRPADTPWYADGIFRLETGNNCELFGLGYSKSADDRYGFAFDGLLTFDVASTGSTLTFAENSVFNCYEVEEGHKSSGHVALLCCDNSTTHHTIVFKPNTTTRWPKIWYKSRSDSGSNTVRFEGGDHHVYGDFLVHRDVGQASTAVVEVLGGKLTVDGMLSLDKLSTLAVSGSSEVSFLNSFLYMPYSGDTAVIRLTATDDAVIKGRLLFMNRAASSDSAIELSGRATMSLSDTSQLASAAGSKGLIKLSGEAKMSHWNLYGGGGANAEATIDLSDSAELTVGRQNDWIGGAGSRVKFAVRDNATFKEDNIYFSWNVGNENDATALVDVDLAGGIVSHTKGISFVVAPESKVRFAGSAVTTGALAVKRVAGVESYRSDVKLTDGTVMVRGTATLATLDATGGTLVANEVTGDDILFNGTVVSPYATDQELIRGITSAKVGTRGLILNALGKTAYVNQAFTDAAEGAGRVAVTGTGTVKARQASAHATTELLSGTLGFDGQTGAVTFGQALVFNGGTLDLSGTSGIVCQTLMTGTERSYVAYAVTANGTYPLLTVTDGVTLATLRRIKFANRLAGHSYSWAVETTEAGTLCSLVVGDGLDVTVDEGTETLELSGDGTILTKHGAGTLVVSGADEVSETDWTVDGGKLVATAIGESVGVTLKDGTFAYTGTQPTRVTGPLNIAADANKHPVIIRTEGDLTFTSATATHGELVKTGAGTLTFDVGQGAWNLGLAVPGGDLLNGNGTITLPESGASPTGTEIGSLRGVSVLEGTLEVKGQGADKSTVRTLNNAVVGSAYASTVPAVLRVLDARFEYGSGSHSGAFCQNLPAGNPAPVIALTNAYLYADACALGPSAEALVRPEIRMKDSTFYNHYNVTIGSQNVRPVIVADNSKLYSTAQIQWQVNGLTSMEFFGPEAMFGSTDISTVNNNGAGRIKFNNAGGIRDSYMKFSDGARLVVSRGLWFLNDNAGTVTRPVVFDGGIFEILKHNSGLEYYSQMAQTATQGFQADAGGLTVRVAADTTHAITFPIRGTGKVTKDGAGTLKLLESWYVNWGNNDSHLTSDQKLLQNAGGLKVAEGTLMLNGGLVAGQPAVEVAADAVLDLANTDTLACATLVGGGTVKNGSLTGRIVRQPAAETVEPYLTFESVTLPADQVIEIDFSQVDAVDNRKHAVVVAKLDADSTVGTTGLDLSGWKAVGINVSGPSGRKARRSLMATFTRASETGLVTLEYTVNPGFTIYIR